MLSNTRLDLFTTKKKMFYAGQFRSDESITNLYLTKERLANCLIHSLNRYNSTIMTYTDGSISESKLSTTRTLVIPHLKLQRSSKIAELFGIFQALRAVYLHDRCPPEKIIFCDTSSGIRAGHRDGLGIGFIGRLHS